MRTFRSFFSTAVQRGKKGRQSAAERRAAKVAAEEEMRAKNKAMKEKLKNTKAASDMALSPEQEAARAKVAADSAALKAKQADADAEHRKELKKIATETAAATVHGLDEDTLAAREALAN